MNIRCTRWRQMKEHTETNTARYNSARKWLIFWTSFIGIGAVAGGLSMIIDPSGKTLHMDAMLPFFQKQAAPCTHTLLQEASTQSPFPRRPAQTSFAQSHPCSFHSLFSSNFLILNGFGAYYSETATPKSTTRQICRGNYTQTGLLQRFRGDCPQLFMLNPFKPPQQILTDI